MQRVRRSRFGRQNDNSHTLEYKISTDDPNMMSPFVYAGALVAGPDPLPPVGAPVNLGGIVDGTYVDSVDVVSIEGNARQWVATVQAGKLQPGQQPGDAAAGLDPLARPTRWWIEYQEQTVIVEKDRFGTAITNTVGDAPDDAFEEIDPVLILCGSKNYGSLDEVIEIGQEYHRSVNSTKFRKAEPRCARMLPLQVSDVQFEGNTEFISATFRFAYNPSTWDREYLNRGWRYRPAAGQPPVDALDKKTKLPPMAPVKLAADGTLLADGAAPHFVKREVLTPKNYNDLDL